MINAWLELENILESQRLMGILFDLGIATKEQIAKALGWDLKKVTWTIDEIRRKAKKNKKNPDDWIRFWRFSGNSTNVFTLGKIGIEIVCDLLEQEVGKRKPLKGNVAHFLGTNDILIRLIDAGQRPEWYSQKEVASYLFHKFGEKEFVYDLDRVTGVKYRRGKVPLDPDAMIITDNKEKILIEYDTGSQSPHVIESKCDRYFQMLPKLGSFTVVFVTKKKRRLEEVIPDALRTVYNETYKGKLNPYPAYVFLEGEETPFLSGISKANPILDINQMDIEQVGVSLESIKQRDTSQEKIEQLELELSNIKKRLSETEAKLNRKIGIENELEKWYQGLESLSGGLFGKALANYLKDNPFPLHKK